MSGRSLPTDDRLLELAAAHARGQLSPEDAAELEARCAADPEAMRTYLACLDLEAELSFPRVAITQPAAVRAASAGRTRRHGIPPAAWAVSSIAAALLIAATAFAIYFFVLSENRTPNIEDRTSSSPIATLIETTGGTLNTPHDYPSEGHQYAAGEYSLSGDDSGTAEFMLTNSVNVRFRGPTRMIMHHDMAVSLTRGTVDFVVPKDAKGFTVHLPDESRIVDLGTAFRVGIDEAGHATLRVAEGSVQWVAAGPDARPVLVRAGQEARLIDGQPVASTEAVVVASDRIVSGSATGTLIAIDVPYQPSLPATASSDSDRGFKIANGQLAAVHGDSPWEPDGTPMDEAENYRLEGTDARAIYTFNLAASGVDIPDGAIINAVYTTWIGRANSGATYRFTEGATSDSIEKRHAGPLEAALVLRWTDDSGTIHEGSFERLFTGPIVVTGGDGFQLSATRIGNSAQIDAVIIDVTLPAEPAATSPLDNTDSETHLLSRQGVGKDAISE